MVGTAATGIVGLVLLQVITQLVARSSSAFEVEQLFGNARLMAAGLLIVVWAHDSIGRQATTRLRAWCWPLDEPRVVARFWRGKRLDGQRR